MASGPSSASTAMPTPGQRVGVLGMGIVSPLGHTLDGAWSRLMAGDTAIDRMTFDGLPDIAAARCDFDPATVLGKLAQVGTERVSLMALGAVRRALDDAGVSSAWPDPERVGLFVGTGMGGASSIDAGYAAMYRGRRMPPLTVPAGMANGAAAVIALHTGIRGPVMTYAIACASGAAAMAEAAHALGRGEIDIAICGGAEAILTRGTVAAWQALRTLAPPDGADAGRSCRPFAADRSGLALGEGAAFFVLQREADLAASGRRPRVWLAGSGMRCDATHLTNPDVRGQVSAMRAALRASNLTSDDVGYCNAHGTATQAGDPVECEALRQVWGEGASRLAVSSTKASHGHLLGAAGALEAVWTVLAVQTAQVPPTRGMSLDTIDPACSGLAHVVGEGADKPALRHAISNSFAFGGTNVSLVFSRD